MVSDLFLSIQGLFLHFILFLLLRGFGVLVPVCLLSLAFSVGCLGGGIYLLVLGVALFGVSSKAINLVLAIVPFFHYNETCRIYVSVYRVHTVLNFKK